MEESGNRSDVKQSSRNDSVAENVSEDNDDQWSRNSEPLTCLLSPIPQYHKSARSKTPNCSHNFGKHFNDASFEHNQSLPCWLNKSLRRRIERHAANLRPTLPLRKTLTMERLHGDGLLGCRFSAGRSRGSFSVHCPDLTALKRSVASFLASQEQTMGAGERSPPSRSLKSTNTASFNTATGVISHNSSTTAENSSAVCPVPWAPLESMSTSAHSGINLHRSVMLNPNKAVFTFDMKTMQILMVNQIACRLLGYSPQELTGLKLIALLHRPHSHSILALGEEHLDTTEGSTLGLSGKVVEMVSREGMIVPVSLWLRSLPTEDRCLAVAEPVERRIAQIEIDSCGRILSADQETMTLFQYKREEIEGEDLTTLIPAFTMPSSPEYLSSDVRKQKATGRTKYGVAFPLCLRLREIPYNEEADADLTSNSSISLVTYSVVIWVFSNMSGLMVLSLEGNIDQCNHHFANILFGHPQNNLLGKHITTVIPNFSCEIEYQGDDTLMLPPTVQLGEDGHEDQIMQAALDSDSTTPQAFRHDTTCRSNGDSGSRSTNILSLDRSMVGDSYRMCSSLTELTDLANRLNLTLDDDTTSPSLQNDIHVSTAANIPSSATNGSCHASELSEHNSESQEEKTDCINGNSTKNTKNQSTCTTDLMCTCTDHTFEQPADDDTSATSISGVELQGYSQLLTAADASVASGYREGYYVGYARHRDGSDIEIAYLVKQVTLRCGRKVYCVWISRNSEDIQEDNRDLLDNLTLASSFNSTTIEHTFGQSASRPSSLSLHSQCEDELVAGEYSQHYTTLEQIGKGAFGYVKMAFRNQDGLLVITKFIHKQKVHQQCWVDDAKLRRRVPLEISLLNTVRHPNIAVKLGCQDMHLPSTSRFFDILQYNRRSETVDIYCIDVLFLYWYKNNRANSFMWLRAADFMCCQVQVLDVFENATFFQMVMQKHGAGMDLFDFVDRTSKLDEPLISYIFRQIVAAVAYLHSLQILHRDIKDENVIIDQHFRVKLIDFGSATFMSSDRLFSTFCGTMEYCSPEVLAGNKYEGPELEVWSLGVTLYVLNFGENPFFDVEETVRAELHPPKKASSDLLDLLHAMLERDPIRRCKIPELTEHPWVNQPVDPTAYSFKELVNCSRPEWQPYTYYADYRQAYPTSESFLGVTANNTANEAHANVDDDNDHTDLASSNSLTSLTPVDDVLLNSSTHADRKDSSESPEPPGDPPVSGVRGPASSTPFKTLRRRPSQLSTSSSSSSTAGAAPEVATSTSVMSSLSSSSSTNSTPSHCPSLSRSSVSVSPSSSTSLSSSPSCSDFGALSTSKQEPDSLTQALLADFTKFLADQALSGAAPSISPLPTSEQAVNTEAGDELSDDDFEEVESEHKRRSLQKTEVSKAKMRLESELSSQSAPPAKNGSLVQSFL